MAEARAERRLAAILATDVVGYSRLMGGDEEGTLAALKSLRKSLIDPKIAEHRGRIVKTTGDGALVEFASAVDAVRCAIDIQRAMMERNAEIPEDRRIELRIGINVGDIIIEGEDIYGDGVNVAARLEGIAKAGGICISRQGFEQIEGKLQFAYRELGPQNLKNITKPIEVFSIEVDETGGTPGQSKPNRRSNIAGQLTGCV
jgi:class 3 adenylate cyclase